jgi:hypothetical protein
MSESVRLFHGNPQQPITLKKLPTGERRCYGEAQPAPAPAPTIPGGSTAVQLAHGNAPINPIRDNPIEAAKLQGTRLY